MLESKLMFAHLWKDCTDVQMNITWVRYLQTLINCRLAKVQVIILNLKSLLKIRQCTSELLGTTEDTSKVIVSHCSISITFLCQWNCLVQKFKCYIEILYKKTKQTVRPLTSINTLLLRFQFHLYLPFYRKLMERILHIIAASLADFVN